jgi:hypothetical protein
MWYGFFTAVVSLPGLSFWQIDSNEPAATAAFNLQLSPRHPPIRQRLILRLAVENTCAEEVFFRNAQLY